MKGQADEETRSRVVETLESNDPNLITFLEARRQRIIRVLQGPVDFGSQPIEASLSGATRRAAGSGGEDANAER
jgi:hypothetical protein